MLSTPIDVSLRLDSHPSEYVGTWKRRGNDRTFARYGG
jgi:hypothetical protein